MAQDREGGIGGTCLDAGTEGEGEAAMTDLEQSFSGYF